MWSLCVSPSENGAYRKLRADNVQFSVNCRDGGRAFIFYPIRNWGECGCMSIALSPVAALPPAQCTVNPRTTDSILLS